MGIELNMSTALRWRAVVAVLLFGGGGLVLLAISVFGLTGQVVGERIGGVAVSVVLLGFGAFALRGATRPSVRVVVDEDGLQLRGRPGAFQVRWPELRGVVVERERRSWGRSRYWFYRMLITPGSADFAADHPEMAARFAGPHYIYDLGRIGRAGRRLDRALREHSPTLFAGVRSR